MTTSAHASPSSPLAVQVDGLVAEYDGRVVLDRVNMQARQGEITVVLGESGCGKTTLLRHIVGLLTPKAGRVCINGRNVHAAGEEERERILRDIGMSFQGGALFSSLTLEENIALPIIEHTRVDRETANLLARMKLCVVGLEQAARLLPAELSGGMRKRAAVARALALDPGLLLFDELSAGLDPVTARELDELILRLKDHLGVTIVIVTHELGSIQMIADRAVMLDAGRVLATGPLEEVRQTDHPKIQAFFDRRPRARTLHGDLRDSLIVNGERDGTGSG